MNEDPIPFRSRMQPAGNGADHAEELDDAQEVTLDTPTPPGGRVTERLPDEPGNRENWSLLDVALIPLEVLPPETQRHLRAAGREAGLVATSLAGGLLKGLAVTLNAVAEVLNDYSERHSKITDLDQARQRRQRVDIEVE
jgi:hypothetical protein